MSILAEGFEIKGNVFCVSYFLKELDESFMEIVEENNIKASDEIDFKAAMNGSDVHDRYECRRENFVRNENGNLCICFEYMKPIR